jgi:hypothetical protein
MCCLLETLYSARAARHQRHDSHAGNTANKALQPESSNPSWSPEDRDQRKKVEGKVEGKGSGSSWRCDRRRLRMYPFNHRQLETCYGMARVRSWIRRSDHHLSNPSFWLVRRTCRSRSTPKDCSHLWPASKSFSHGGMKTCHRGWSSNGRRWKSGVS